VNVNGRPSLNGTAEAPSLYNGASAVSGTQTVFPNVPINKSLQSLFYYSSRHFVGGFSLLRWLLGGCVVGALIWGVGNWPGRWWVSAGFVLLWGGILWAYHYWRRNDFVAFTPASFPEIVPEPLPASEKVPLFATGYLTVENKEQRFTWLPGFFRTFATREHALMCYVASGTQLGIGKWPDSEVGLWYLFFQPSDLVAISWGELTFGRTSYPTIAVTYQRRIAARGRFRPERLMNETLYLSVTCETDGKLIAADLLHEKILQRTDQKQPPFARLPHG